MTEAMTDPNQAASGHTVMQRLMEWLIRDRRLMRAPIRLYRAGWGWVFGPRLVMIEHLGRSTHEPRFVVVEVVDRGPQSLWVASGFGAHAQWYRNLEANGVAFLSTGSAKRVRAAARMLTQSESAAVLRRYAQRHPRAWRALGPVMTHLSDDAVPPIVEFTPVASRTTQGQSSTAPTS